MHIPLNSLPLLEHVVPENQLPRYFSSKNIPHKWKFTSQFYPLNPTSFWKLSSYVPQHDACLPLLTIYETFAFASSLPNLITSEISIIVNSLLNELRLTHLSHTRLVQFLTGGERRRVSIGLSHFHDTAVLLLNAPTSGLDSNSDFNVIETLKSIAKSRQRTVSLEILSTIDKILLLSRGKVVHHGRLTSLEALLLSNGFTVPPQLNSLE